MKKNLVFASILTLAMGLAQAQTQPTAPNPSGSQPTAPSDQGVGKTRTQAPADMGQTSTPTGRATLPDAGMQQSFKGCLVQASGKWSLAADNGQTIALSGSDDQLSSHNNQQVSIQGTQSDDGSVKVSSIDKVADSCNSSGLAATSTTDQNKNADASSTTASTSSTQSSTTSQAPPVGNSSAMTNQGAGTEQTSNPGANANNDQNAPTSTSQTAASAQNAPATNDQNSVRHISDMDQNQNPSASSSSADQNAAGQKLPQTASPLPLLGLIGLGSLVSGLVARRKK
jgi:trimeric autotransporter adhesin